MILITAAGKDRPGIVASLTRILYEAGCNIEDTSMTRLRGEFAMILMVRPPGRVTLNSLRARFKSAFKSRLSISMKELTRGESSRRTGEPDESVMISVYGADRPGIVARVCGLLAVRKINITDLNTRVIGSKNAPIYVMVMEADLPRGISIDALERDLSPLRRELSVDIALHPIEIAHL
jgi:glycine cleavage system transcriptional repressor